MIIEFHRKRSNLVLHATPVVATAEVWAIVQSTAHGSLCYRLSQKTPPRHFCPLSRVGLSAWQGIPQLLPHPQLQSVIQNT